MTGNLPTDAITLTFVSDTSDVQPFSFGDLHGWENTVGTASISVNDYASGALVAQGTFLADHRDAGRRGDRRKRRSLQAIQANFVWFSSGFRPKIKHKQELHRLTCSRPI
jgi:hypothetical protein